MSAVDVASVPVATEGNRGAPRGRVMMRARGARGGPPRGRGGPRGAPRGGPRGAPGRGGPPRGGPNRGRGSPAGSSASVSAPATGPASQSPVAFHPPPTDEAPPAPVPTAASTTALSPRAATVTSPRAVTSPVASPRAVTSPTPTPTPAPAATLVKTPTPIPTASSPAPSGGGGGGIAARWAQQMAKQKEDEFQMNRNKLRGRRRGGVAFMDSQIRSLIDEIKKLNTSCGRGMASVQFGILFSATQESQPALAATLNVAKKRGNVDFEGDMLMQGVHDNVVISVLSDVVEDSAVFQSIIGAAPITLDSPQFTSSGCHICQKTVYPMDRVNANDKTMHKNCFRCVDCNVVLKVSSFAFNTGKFYCENHFQQRFKAGSGYNF